MAFKSPLRGIQAHRRRQDLLHGGQNYIDRVLASGPIAYWPLWEMSGTVAQDLVANLRAPDPGSLDGTYARDVSVMGTGTSTGAK